MARTLSFDGQVMAAPASATITVGGVEVYNGAMGEGVALETDAILATATVDALGEDGTTVEVSISVTAGILNIGEIWADYADGEIGPKGSSTRSSILINGVAPESAAGEWNGTVFTPSEDWLGWRFEVAAGETISFDLAVDAAQ